MKKAFSSWHVGVAAEAFVAAQLARCGLDVSVQYGADQPEYDLIAVKGERLLKISVKGSQDGAWGLTQSYLKDANYHGAIDLWLLRHKPRTVLAFVQFKGTTLDQLPRIYLATPAEVAGRLKATAKGRGDTMLHEKHQWSPKAHAAGTAEEIPTAWCFSMERLEHLLASA